MISMWSELMREGVCVCVLGGVVCSNAGRI